MILKFGCNGQMNNCLDAMCGTQCLCIFHLCLILLQLKSFFQNTYIPCTMSFERHQVFPCIFLDVCRTCPLFDNHYGTKRLFKPVIRQKDVLLPIYFTFLSAPSSFSLVFNLELCDVLIVVRNCILDIGANFRKYLFIYFSLLFFKKQVQWCPS